jgi:small subunit ribosomal protein S16
MLKIRLTRVGKKNKATFRVVVCEHTKPIKGKFVEILGSYDPHGGKKVIVKKDRLKYWMDRGVRPTKSLKSLLKESK